MITKLLIAIGLAITVFAVANMEDDCADMVYASQVPLWIADHGGQVSYENGNWYDRAGALIGTSAFEDSDVCPN